MRRVFAPGCALMIYKPELATKLHNLLKENFGEMELLNICCHHDPGFTQPTEVINICPGCDKRFRKDYQHSSTISLWEILAESDFFTFPNYQGKQMTILDACPTREMEKVHDAIRILLQKMNITLVEPKNTRTKSSCCGDSYFGVIPIERVKEQMVKRSSEMPLQDVVVYCVSCIKSMAVGGKNPHYLVDLLWGDETLPGTTEPEAWHRELESYMEQH